jgi:hypothetical protein
MIGTARNIKRIKMLAKKFLTVLMSVAALLGGAIQSNAQQTEDTLRINTRVVFVDTLVQEKKTAARARSRAG